nr:putative exonuclease v, mitochondrial [Quercus suber]
MASASPLQSSVGDGNSDYGSELDDDAAQELLSQAESQPLKNLVVESIEEPLLKDGCATERSLARLARTSHDRSVKHRPNVEVEYDQSNRVAFSRTCCRFRGCEKVDADALTLQRLTATRDTSDGSAEQALSPEPSLDTRSPLLRFRTPPKKTLSVTDLVSPAWCELQYWYSLTKYGRIRRTPAMKQGSSVHKVLEEQVHTEVPVEVETKEDRFGLRIWNIIQGLRTLRRTGITRELEVWGVVDGEVVNGVIDEITTSCPDEQMESEMLHQTDTAKPSTNKDKKHQTLEKDQRTLTEFLTSASTATVLETSRWSSTSLHEKPRTLYVKDIKTRQSKSVPAANSGQLRPVHMQLMLYHHLLSGLSANTVPAELVFRRYNIHPHSPFSDVFLAQISTLGFENSPSPSPSAPDLFEENLPSPEDPIATILAHNTLDSLWTLMLSEFTAAIPTASLSNLLTAEYRTASDGTLLGRRSFALDADAANAYVADEMRWWRGERPARGVELEEAFKCRFCDFAPTCTWRIEKVEEGLRKSKLRHEQKSGKE